MSSTDPNIQEIWTRIEGMLEQHVPDTAATLAPPATDREIAELASAIGLDLPDDLTASLKIHNGQNDPSMCHYFTDGGIIASTQGIADHWRMVTKLDDSFREQYTEWDDYRYEEWWSPLWIPFTIDQSDCYCINLNPDVRPGGHFGEIVCHIHNNPHEAGIASSYSAWLDDIAHRLENQKFIINEHGTIDLDYP